MLDRPEPEGHRKALLTLLGYRRDAIRSPLSPTACAESLSAGIDAPLTLFGKKPVIGQVSPSGGSLKKRLSYRNDLRMVARLSIESSAEGSRILIRSFMSTYAISFMVGLFIFACVMLLTDLSSGGVSPFAFFPVFVLILCAIMVGAGRWLSRDHHDFLLAFVRDRVKGQVESPVDARFGAPIVR